ncbi:MAG: HU family DNA-binding protein [Spirochaetota bacterium]
MTKADIAGIIREEVKLDKKDILYVIDRFIDEIIKAADDGDSVEIRGFGTFSRENRKSREIFSPIAKKKVDVPERKVLVFKPSKGTEIIIKGV